MCPTCSALPASDQQGGPPPLHPEENAVTVLAEVVRSGFVEGRHHGSLVVVDSTGRRLLSAGVPDELVFPRSSSKPLQAVAMLRTGVAQKYSLTDRHVALAAASHSGEQAHVDVVRDLLTRAAVAESDLGCPRDWPMSDAVMRTLVERGIQPARIFHNCSGKHAAMLATCAASGWAAQGYLSPDHPLQQHIRSVIEELAGDPVTATGVDGCGAPVLALTLTGLARAFSRLVTAEEGTEEHRVAVAMRAHPDLVGGTGRDVTRVMAAVPGLVAKDGAEGVYAAATADGVAVALKIDDGAERARMPVLVAALRLVGAAGDSQELDALARPPLLGGGDRVGEVRAARLPPPALP
jgi:L-asparaginase II